MCGHDIPTKKTNNKEHLLIILEAFKAMGISWKDIMSGTQFNDVGSPIR